MLDWLVSTQPTNELAWKEEFYYHWQNLPIKIRQYSSIRLQQNKLESMLLSFTGQSNICELG